MDEKQDENIIKLDADINGLTEEKKKLIEEITRAMKELKYKRIELKALIPMVEKAKQMNIDYLMKTSKMLDFKVATSSMSTKAEKKYLDKIIEIEKQIRKARPFIRAGKRVKILNKDVEDLQAKIATIDQKLKEMRETIRELIKKKRMAERGSRRGMESYGEEPDHMISMEDMVEIENEKESS